MGTQTICIYLSIADSLLFGLFEHVCLLCLALLCLQQRQLLLLLHHFQLVLKELLGPPSLLLPLLLCSIMHTKYGLHRVRLTRGEGLRLETHLHKYVCTRVEHCDEYAYTRVGDVCPGP